MNYTELKTLATAYADRTSDVEITNNIDNFILMAEVKLNRVIKVSESAIRATVLMLSDKEYYALPSDFNGLRDVELQVDGKRSTCSYLSPEQMNVVQDTGLVGPYYTIIAGNIHILPLQTTDTVIEIVYYAKLDNLTNSTLGYNWLSTDFPDIYLAAIMVEIASFIKNPEGASIWEQRLDKAVNALSDSDISNRWSGSALQMRVL